MLGFQKSREVSLEVIFLPQRKAQLGSKSARMVVSTGSTVEEITSQEGSLLTYPSRRTHIQYARFSMSLSKVFQSSTHLTRD